MTLSLFEFAVIALLFIATFAANAFLAIRCFIWEKRSRDSLRAAYSKSGIKWTFLTSLKEQTGHGTETPEIRLARAETAQSFKRMLMTILKMFAINLAAGLLFAIWVTIRKWALT